MRFFFVTILLFASSAFAEDPAFRAAPLALKPPEGVYIEEVPAIAASPDGEVIYVFNRGQHPLLAFRKNGTFVREIGHGLFEKPHGLRVDSAGAIWTTDIGNHLVIKFSPAGEVEMVFGKKGTGDEGWFDRDYNHLFLNRPSDVAFDEAGNIYIADGGNFRIVKYTPNGDPIAHFGEKGDGPGQFNFPHSLVIDGDGRILVADRENRRIQLFSEDGEFLEEWADIGHPYGLALGAEGRLWMTDARKEELVLLSLTGERLGAFRMSGKSAGRYGFLHGVMPYAEGVLVSDILNWKVEYLSPTASANR